jgi:hypothetical protein
MAGSVLRVALLARLRGHDYRVPQHGSRRDQQAGLGSYTGAPCLDVGFLHLGERGRKPSSAAPAGETLADIAKSNGRISTRRRNAR